MESTNETVQAPAETPAAPPPDPRRDRLAALLPGCSIERTEARCYWVEVPTAGLLDAVSRLRGDGVAHLTTIVGEDMRDHFQVSYVLAGDVVAVLKARLERERPEVPSLASMIPGAAVYEGEMHDLLGIVPVGHPDLRRQALPDGFPEGVYPLRKDAVLPKPAFVPMEDE